MKRYLLLLFCCLWASQIVKADVDHYLDSCALCLKENDVKTKRQSFMTGAESYYGKLLNGQEQELSHVLQAVDIYVDYFSALDYTTVPQWELRALVMAGDGKLDEALAIYDKQNLLGPRGFGHLGAYQFVRHHFVPLHAFHGIDWI